ncbi:hypothetical protein [Bacillus bombysepticus]|uniref:hypothetical protein n=1 Tax=Bacillus bombysepticus TaxID=658666 RepID=UPI003017B09D
MEETVEQITVVDEHRAETLEQPRINRMLIKKELEDIFSPELVSEWGKTYPYIFSMMGQIESFILKDREWKFEYHEAQGEYKVIKERKAEVEAELESLRSQIKKYQATFSDMHKVRDRLQDKEKEIVRGIERKRDDLYLRKAAYDSWFSKYLTIIHSIESNKFGPPQAYRFYKEFRDNLHTSVREDYEAERRLLNYINRVIIDNQRKRNVESRIEWFRSELYTQGWNSVRVKTIQEIMEEKELFVPQTTNGMPKELEAFQRYKEETEKQLHQLQKRFYEWLLEKQECLRKEYELIQMQIFEAEDGIRNSRSNVIQAYVRMKEYKTLRQKRRILKNEQEYIQLLAEKGFSALNSAVVTKELEEKQSYQENYHDNWIVNRDEYLDYVYADVSEL